MDARSRARLLPAAISIGLLWSVVNLPVVLATSVVQPLPGEKILSEAEQAAALQSAPLNEQAGLARFFNNPSLYLPVAYTRAYFRLEVDAKGAQYMAPMGVYSASDSQLRIPSLKTASINGSGGLYDLYISTTVTRSPGGGCCYEWTIDNFFDWRGTNGMDAFNNVVEKVGTSWAGDLYLYYDYWSGYYNLYGSTRTPLDIYRSDATPNQGVGWSFHEWKQRNSQVFSPADYGRMDAVIRENSYQNRTDNTVMKYFHTKGGTASYSLSFYQASISITPSDGNEWSVAAYANFTH